MCSADIFLGVLALLFPPLPVWVKCGICSADSLINILLCCLGYIPGVLHAWYIIAKLPEPPYEYEALPQDREGGRVTYVYVQNPAHNQQPKPQDAPRSTSAGPAMNYGTQSGSAAAQDAGEGSSDGVPPSYAEVVAEGTPSTPSHGAGDHKVQSSD